MEKNNKKQNVKRLPGFYIALCGCVLAIGVAGYFTEQHSKKPVDTASVSTGESDSSVFSESIDPHTDNALGGNDSVAVNEPIIYDTAEETTAPEAEATQNEPTPQPTEAVPEFAVDNPDVEEAAVIVSAEETSFTVPVNGAVIGEFSNELAYNETLGDYRTHDGIDLAADTGCSVSASADGTVEEVSADTNGVVITISHNDGFKTKYSCLESAENIEAGKEIKSGDVIGIVGESVTENVKDSHLHFEMYKDNSPVNPLDYLR